MEKMKLSFQKDIMNTYGFSWPQRNFKCSFCKQEYKSAQALGGHMNVHRRDRAKLMRELSPSSYGLSSNTNPNPSFSSLSNNTIIVSSNPNISPNINISSSPTTSKLVKYLSYGKPLISSFSSGDFEEGKKCLKKKREDEFRVLKKRKNVLKIDGDEGVKLIKEDKQEVDLELRLGFS